MPTFRSITVSLISQFDLLTIPEFPHPSTFNKLFSAKPSLINRDGSLVSVYIPSYPSSQFWISYSIAPPHPPKVLYYFKLFLRGSCVVSWGCGENNGYKGKTMFALYKSGQKWVDDAVLERRVFCFGDGSDNPKSTSCDPLRDIMELKVYRSNGRKQFAEPVIETFPDPSGEKGRKRSQQRDQPWINLANAGLVEYGAPPSFYKYALVDPLDQPFATFRYYYGDWEYLKTSNEISSTPSGSSIHSKQSSNNLSVASRPPTSSSSRSNMDPPISFSPMISPTARSPPPTPTFPPRSPSPPPHPPHKPLPAITLTPAPPLITPAPPLVSALKRRYIPRSSSIPSSISFSSFRRGSPSPAKPSRSSRRSSPLVNPFTSLRRSPSPVKSTIPSRSGMRALPSIPRSSSLGMLEDIVNSAVRRRAHDNTTENTTKELTDNISNNAADNTANNATENTINNAIDDITKMVSRCAIQTSPTISTAPVNQRINEIRETAPDEPRSSSLDSTGLILNESRRQDEAWRDRDLKKKGKQRLLWRKSDG